MKENNEDACKYIKFNKYFTVKLAIYLLSLIVFVTSRSKI